MKRIVVSASPVIEVLYGRAGRLLALYALYGHAHNFSLLDTTTFAQTAQIDRFGPQGAAISLAAHHPFAGRMLEAQGQWPADAELPAGAEPKLEDRLPRVEVWFGGTLLGGFHPDGRQVFYLTYSTRSGPPTEATLSLLTLDGVQRAAYAGSLVTGRAARVAVSASGEWVAAWRVNKSVAVHAVEGGKARHLLPAKDVVTALSFAPCGAALAAAVGRVVCVWDAARGTPLHRFRAFRKHATALAWSPDGRLLLAGSREGRVRVWEAATGRELADLDWEGGPIHCLSVAPDGATAVAGCEDGSAVVWDLDS